MYRLVFDGTEFFATALADASEGALVRVPFGSGLAVDDECLYVADTATGVYSVAKAEWTLAPMP